MYGKSPIEYEEPISNLFYSIAYNISKIYNIDPNIITTLRLIIMIFIYYLLYKTSYKKLAALLFIFCYFLDHLDGEMARQK